MGRRLNSVFYGLFFIVLGLPGGAVFTGTQLAAIKWYFRGKEDTG